MDGVTVKIGGIKVKPQNKERKAVAAIMKMITAFGATNVPAANVKTTKNDEFGIIIMKRKMKRTAIKRKT